MTAVQSECINSYGTCSHTCSYILYIQKATEFYCLTHYLTTLQSSILKVRVITLY